MIEEDLSVRQIALLQSIFDLRKSSAPRVRVFFRSCFGFPHYYFVVGVVDERLKRNRLNITSFTDAVLVAKVIAFVFGARYEDLKDIISFDEFQYLSGRSCGICDLFLSDGVYDDRRQRKNESDRQ